MILISSPRPEGIAVILTLAPGQRIMMTYTDDGTTRDISELVPDLLLEYVLRGAPEHEALAEETGITVGHAHLDGPGEPQLAIADLASRNIGQIPAERLLPLVGAAVRMAISDAVAEGDGTGEVEQAGADDGALP